MFLAMLFGSAAVAGGMIAAAAIQLCKPIDVDVYRFSRAVTYSFLNIYAIKMVGVFMISTATITMRTSVIPRWTLLLGYAIALLLLVSIGFNAWAELLFRLWVLLLSVYPPEIAHDVLCACRVVKRQYHRGLQAGRSIVAWPKRSAGTWSTRIMSGLSVRIVERRFEFAELELQQPKLARPVRPDGPCRILTDHRSAGH